MEVSENQHMVVKGLNMSSPFRTVSTVTHYQQPRGPEMTPLFSTSAPSSLLRRIQSSGVSADLSEYQVHMEQGVTIYNSKKIFIFKATISQDSDGL